MKPTALLLLLLFILTGCATRAPVPQRPAPSADAGAAETAPRREPPRPQSEAERAALPELPAAAAGLVQRAERASAGGDHDAAASLLERALRIAPEHPVLWQNLAVVRYRQGDYAQAESLALKSNSLAGGVASLRRQNWSLIAVVRRLGGDEAGARQAEARAREPAGG